MDILLKSFSIAAGLGAAGWLAAPSIGGRDSLLAKPEIAADGKPATDATFALRYILAGAGTATFVAAPVGLELASEVLARQGKSLPPVLANKMLPVAAAGLGLLAGMFIADRVLEGVRNLKD